MPQATPREVAHQMGRTVDSVTNPISTQYGAPVTSNELVLRSKLFQPANPVATQSKTAYFVYMGLTTRSISPQRVFFYVNTMATGSPVGEVGVFSSPTAPNRMPQTLECLMVESKLDELVTDKGVKGNVKAFTANVEGGTHIWAGCRIDAKGSRDPSIVGLTQDFGMGEILSLDNQQPFTFGKTYKAQLIPVTLNWQCPNLLLHIA